MSTHFKRARRYLGNKMKKSRSPKIGLQKQLKRKVIIKKEEYIAKEVVKIFKQTGNIIDFPELESEDIIGEFIYDLGLKLSITVEEGVETVINYIESINDLRSEINNIIDRLVLIMYKKLRRKLHINRIKRKFIDFKWNFDKTYLFFENFQDMHPPQIHGPPNKPMNDQISRNVYGQVQESKIDIGGKRRKTRKTHRKKRKTRRKRRKKRRKTRRR